MHGHTYIRQHKLRFSYLLPTELDKPFELQKTEARRISKQSAHESGKVVSPTHRPHLRLSRYLWYLFQLQTESIPGS